MNRPFKNLVTDDNINSKALIFWKSYGPFESKSNHRADFYPSRESHETHSLLFYSAAIIGLSLILFLCILTYVSLKVRRWFNRRYSFEAGIARMSEVKRKTPKLWHAIIILQNFSGLKPGEYLFL